MEVGWVCNKNRPIKFVGLQGWTEIPSDPWRANAGAPHAGEALEAHEI